MGHFPVRYVCLPEGSMNWGVHYVAEESAVWLNRRLNLTVDVLTNNIW